MAEGHSAIRPVPEPGYKECFEKKNSLKSKERPKTPKFSLFFSSKLLLYLGDYILCYAIKWPPYCEHTIGYITK